MPENIDLKDLQLDHQDRVRRPARGANSWKWAFLLLLIGTGGWIGWRESDDRQVPGLAVKTEKVGPRRSSGTGGGAVFSATGWIKLPNYHPVTVTPLTAGRLDQLDLVEGDRVEKGQVIARLYAKDYQDELTLARAEAAAAKAELDRLTAGFRSQEVDEARAKVASLTTAARTARETLARSTRLQPSGAVSQEELERHEAALAAARGSLEAAKARLDLLTQGYRSEEIAAGRAALEQARAKVALAASRVEYTQVRAPMTGLVLERLAHQGQWLEPGTGLVTLYDPADLEAQIDVNQEDLSRVFLGQEVALTTRAETNRTFAAKVVLLEPLADRVKNILEVKVKVADPQSGILYPGMVVQARFHPRQEEKVREEEGKKVPSMTIPVAAVSSSEGKTYVFLVQDGRARRREVTLGEIDAGRYTVKAGLARGEMIITSNREYLTDGARVRPGEAER